MIKSVSATTLKAVAESFNEALTSENSVNGINNQPWSRLVNFKLNSKKDLAFEINKRPQGLMKVVGYPFEGADADEMPSTDYVKGQEYNLVASHEFNEEDILNLVGKKALGPDGIGISDVMTDKTYAEAKEASIKQAISSLTAKVYNQMGAIAGGALDGTVTLNKRTGGTDTITTDVINTGAAGTTWDNAATAVPLDDIKDVNDTLYADADNLGNDLSFGSTLMSQEIFHYLIQTDQIKEQVDTLIKGTRIGGYRLTLDEFNANFNRANDVLPSFGRVIVDPRSNYLNDSGAITRIIAANKIYSASGTERTVPGGIPPAPIQIQIVPVRRPEAISNLSSSNVNGFTLEIFEKDTYKTLGSKGRKSWEFHIRGQLTLIQFKPIAFKQVLA